LRSLRLSKLRRLALDDIGVFSEMVLNRQLEPFHHRWIEHQQRSRKSLILAPRGFGKSSSCTILYILWRVAADPNLRVAIIGNTSSQAEALLSEVKQLAQSEPFSEVFPEIKAGERWTNSDVTFSTKTSVTKEANITALGAEGAIISRHFDLIIGDDLVNQENSRTDLQRKKLETFFFQTLMACLEPHGSIHLVGTRYDHGDLYGTLIASSYKQCARIDQAIQKDGTSLWEEKFSIKQLRQMQIDYGSANFAMQYQNDASLSQGEIFKEDWIQFYSTAPEFKFVVQGVDLAISSKQDADYFAMVTIGIDYNHCIYILDAYRNKLSFLGQQQVIIQKFKRFDPATVTIESNAYQAAQIHALRATEPTIRLAPLNTYRDKVTRARRISSYFESKRVFFRRDMVDLIDELLRMPNGDHDDLFDAMEFAISQSLIGVKKKRAYEPGLL
jgi:predicted phage terminase large subunit-like protein